MPSFRNNTVTSSCSEDTECIASAHTTSCPSSSTSRLLTSQMETSSALANLLESSTRQMIDLYYRKGSRNALRELSKVSCRVAKALHASLEELMVVLVSEE